MIVYTTVELMEGGVDVIHLTLGGSLVSHLLRSMTQPAKSTSLSLRVTSLYPGISSISFTCLRQTTIPTARRTVLPRESCRKLEGRHRLT